MGFPVSDQVDLMLPLLRLQPVLGASVVANTTAAENDDDGPHQPKPCRGGERDVSQGSRATSNPEKPINVMGKIPRKCRSEPRAALQAEIHGLGGSARAHLHKGLLLWEPALIWVILCMFLYNMEHAY